MNDRLFMKMPLGEQRGCGKKSRGFSLVEIAIVLVVVGLIAAGGLKGVDAVTSSTKATTTDLRLDRIQDALQVYAMQDWPATTEMNCLPCPADPTTLTGQAQDSNGTYTSACSPAGAAANCTRDHGIVPWVNLGLSKDDVTDGYGNMIDYVLSPSSAPIHHPAFNHAASVFRTFPAQYEFGSLRVNDPNGAEQTPNGADINRAAYVLISHGKDGSGAYRPTGTNASPLVDPHASATQSCNTVAAATCPTAGYIQSQPQGNGTSTGYFDDIVRYVTGPIMVQKCGTSTCGNPG